MRREDIANLVTLFFIEVGLGLIGGAIAASILVPLAYAERGYFAIGSEWLVSVLVAYLVFSFVNNRIFKPAKKERRK